MALFLVITLALAAVVHAAALAANYPINSQLPPVARVSQPFRFVFADSTFANTDSDTKYALKNAPSWLEVDSASRTLSGIPDTTDSGSKSFQLVASNGSDSASMDVTLIVTSDQGPSVGTSLVSQLQTVGPVSYPATLYIHPGQPFSIEFDPSTFHNTHPSTIYYGTSPNNAPLPSWIGFDPSLLKFAGYTPAFPGSGSQEFTFQLIASDVAGFSAVNQTFQLAIGPHILAFNETVQSFNLTRGETFSSPGFASFVTMDGSPISSKSLTSIDAELPDWLSLDKNSISLIGTPPKDAVNQNITITVTDTYHDEAKLMVRLEFMELFIETVKGCEATIGEDFSFVFNQSILTDNSVQLDVDLGDDLSWVHYDPANKTLFGHVPSAIQPETFTIHLKASQGSTENRQDFELNVIQPSDTPSGGSDSSDSSSPSHQKAGIIAISVIIPGAVILSAIILFCCWRRRRKSTTVEDGREPSETKVPPPRPARPDLPNCQPGATGRRSQDQDDKSDEWMSPISPASDLLKLELGPAWNVASFAKPEDSMIAIPEPSPPPRSPKRAFVPLRDPIIEEDKPVHKSPARKQNQRLSFSASPGVRRRTSNRSRREPLKTIQPRAMKRESIQSSRSKRYSKRSSGISTVAAGLPVRMSGAGHGAGGFGPPGHGFARTSWQNTKASFMSDESNLGNMTPLFPRPPPAAARARYSIAESIPENAKRVTLRAVEPDESTISEADSLEAFVHSRAKHRNSSNPLFSAQISRQASSGLRALERARSLRSRADTVSVSTFSDEYRQSIQGRPYSTAMSMSEYGDENRISQYQPLQPPPGLFPLAEGGGHSQSQLSLAQDYRGVISPLPRFWSENSLSSARRLDSGSHPKPPQQLRADSISGIPQSSSLASDLEEHLSRQASPQKAAAARENQAWNAGLEPPPPVKSGSSRGLPVASSGELAFV
ncbi:Axial budding pattern protein 2 [Penicillium rolfsii]|nr:Axial budding pattern protein 2 [Penicillium rolfsii]